MSVSHSRTFAVALLALSTCAGATRIADRRAAPPPALVASADVPPPAGADAVAAAVATSPGALPR